MVRAIDGGDKNRAPVLQQWYITRIFLGRVRAAAAGELAGMGAARDSSPFHGPAACAHSTNAPELCPPTSADSLSTLCVVDKLPMEVTAGSEQSIAVDQVRTARNPSVLPVGTASKARPFPYNHVRTSLSLHLNCGGSRHGGPRTQSVPHRECSHP